jgi:hypothetical protein
MLWQAARLQAVDHLSKITLRTTHTQATDDMQDRSHDGGPATNASCVARASSV